VDPARVTGFDGRPGARADAAAVTSLSWVSNWTWKWDFGGRAADANAAVAAAV